MLVGAGSLHYISDRAQNQYQQAMFSVGNIVCAYDTDGRVPGYGFGARLPDGSVSHCFALNGHAVGSGMEECEGISGLEHHYRSCLETHQLCTQQPRVPILPRGLHI